MNKILWIRTCSCLARRNMSTPPPSSTSSSDAGKNMSLRYRPTNLQKFILVWTKKYKSKEEIPKLVSGETIQRAHSEARIKVANRLMILTALASLGAIFAGKAAAKRGESVHQMNLDWHKQYNEDAEKKKGAKS